MTPSPSPHELDALAPLVESAYSDGVPESAFWAHTTIGPLWVVPLSDFDAMRCVAANWIQQAQDEAKAGKRWQKRAIRAEQIAGFFGFVLAIITAAQILRWILA